MKVCGPSENEYYYVLLILITHTVRAGSCTYVIYYNSLNSIADLNECEFLSTVAIFFLNLLIS